MCQKYTMPHVFTVPSCSQASFLTRDPSKGLEKFPRSPEPKSGAQRDHLASCHDITLGLATTLATTGGGHIYASLIITGWCLAISPEQMRSAYADHHLHGNLRFSASGRHLNTSHSKTVHRQFTFQFSHLCFNNLSLLFVRISSILVSTWPKLLGT